MRRKKTKTRKRTPFAVGREKFQETAAFKEASRRGGRMTGAKRFGTDLHYRDAFVAQ
jgi:hypothetical protein